MDMADISVHWCWVLRFFHSGHNLLPRCCADCKCTSQISYASVRTPHAYIVMRERRIATTVGLILLLLCFTYLPVLAAPFIPHSLGYPFEDQPPFQAMGVWAAGGGGVGAAALSKFG